MKISTKILLAFLVVIVIHLLVYRYFFQNIIVDQLKTDLHQQYLLEKEVAELISFNENISSNLQKFPEEVKELTKQLPEDLMYTIEIKDGTGHTITSKSSKTFDAKGKGPKKIVAEYVFERGNQSSGRTVVRFYTDDYDILSFKGIEMLILYLYISMIFIGIILFFIVIRWILRPVNELSRVTQEIKYGRRDVTFTYHSNDEFGQLFHQYDEMVEEISLVEERQQELMAAIAHDFRTPLTTIKGYASYIASGRVIDPARIQKQMTKIEQRAADLEFLLDELQDHNQLVGHFPINISRLNIREFASRIAEEYATRLDENSIQFLSKIRVSERMHMEADEQKLRRVLENLLNNAIHYNKPDGNILFTCDIGNNEVIFSVIDKGEGIAEEDLPKIFTKFYRTEKSRNRNSGGTGLGLSICQRLIELHSGHIKVTSQLGVGSAFTVFLPLIQPKNSISTSSTKHK
ncbi:sensor histidine kinase [Brevibacillus daliensis]|uniref:sensor histidine kinase n=1 Tax=Brevibacillus daliensis TaxID=2892995 RepID=UPI001E3AD81E|nr:HAMP domain-containing sensor histidine kinase [Brevibacillus daliensis]